MMTDWSARRISLQSRGVTQAYLQPYLDAAAKHGAAFESLLWASSESQAQRFHAICRAVDLHGQSVLDVGCGRADLLDFLIDQGVVPADYTGIEAVEALATAAKAKRRPNVRILHADFVAEPLKMFVAADVVIFSGSLNTLRSEVFFTTLRRAFEATADVLVFNFLSSPALAAKDYLAWHKPMDVMRFAAELTSRVTLFDDYLAGDTTVAMRKEHA